MGREVVIESRRRREVYASIVVCGMNARCSISSPSLWLAGKFGAGLVERAAVFNNNATLENSRTGQ